MVNKPLAVGLFLCVAVASVFLAYGFVVVRFSNPIQEEAVSFYTIFISRGGGSVEPQNLVINDDPAYQNMWKSLLGVNPQCAVSGVEMLPCPAPPKVNFTSTTVVAVFAGQKPSTGYSLDVIQVGVAGSQVIVHSRLTVPGRSCGVGLMLTYPHHIIGFPKTDLQVVFTMETFVFHC